jgi:thiamine-phosphate pyrophosphorylase
MAIAEPAASPGFELWLEALAGLGVDAVQIRSRQATDLALWSAARRAVDAVGDRVQVLVNGRADIALAAGAAGVHLPADGLPIAGVRRLVGAELLIGRSAHSVDEVRNARDEGADYVLLAPIWPSPGKGPALGVEALRQASAAGVPVLALGGIEESAQVAAALAVGAHGIAGIRAFADLELARRLLEIFTPGRPESR